MSLSCSSGCNCIPFAICISSGAPSHLVLRQTTQTDFVIRENSLSSRRDHGVCSHYVRFVLIYCTPLSSPPLEIPALLCSKLGIHLHFLPPCSADQSSQMHIPWSFCTPKCSSVLNHAVLGPYIKDTLMVNIRYLVCINNSEYNQNCLHTFRAIEDFFIIFSIPVQFLFSI